MELRADQIIIEPILSEKSNLAKEGDAKKYTFKVNLEANKIQIQNAVKELFDVEPVACNIQVYSGKPKNTRGRKFAQGKRSDWKKAIVTLKKGDKISSLEAL